jgi:hypothetical protein
MLARPASSQIRAMVVNWPMAIAAKTIGEAKLMVCIAGEAPPVRAISNRTTGTEVRNGAPKAAMAVIARASMGPHGVSAR